MEQEPQATAPGARAGQIVRNDALINHNEAKPPKAEGYQTPQSGESLLDNYLYII